MTIEKAIQRIFWRFGNGKFEPNQNDIDAITEITHWINREKEKRANENRYFGKMVAWAYLNLLRCHYGGKSKAEREIQEILEKPLEHHYEMIRSEIESIELRMAFDAIGLINAFDCEKREDGFRYLEDIRKQHMNNTDIAKSNQHLLLPALEPLEFSKVSRRMNFFISELLNRYGNKP